MVCAACSTAVVLWARAAGLAAASGSASNRAAFVRRGNAGALVTIAATPFFGERARASPGWLEGGTVEVVDSPLLPVLSPA